jgi:hypothetical protein
MPAAAKKPSNIRSYSNGTGALCTLACLVSYLISYLISIDTDRGWQYSDSLSADWK